MKEKIDEEEKKRRGGRIRVNMVEVSQYSSI